MKLSKIKSEQHAKELLAEAKKAVLILTDLLVVIDRARAFSSRGAEVMRRNLLQTSIDVSGGIRVERTADSSREITSELVDAAVRIVNGGN